VTGRGIGPVIGISEIEPLLTIGGVDSVDVSVGLHNPDELLRGVVEIELHLVVGRVGGLRASVLQLLDQVLVGDLGETPALIGIEIDIVDEQGSGVQGGDVHSRVVGRPRGSGVGSGGSPEAVGGIVELEVDLNLMVLQSNEGEGKTGVPGKPELQRDIQDITLDGHSRVGRVLLGGGEVGSVTHHVGITDLVTGGLGQLIPDVQPITVVLVNALTTDLELDALDHDVTEPVQPPEGGVAGNGHVGELHAEVRAVDEITVTGDGAGHLLRPIALAINLNTFILRKEWTIS